MNSWVVNIIIITILWIVIYGLFRISVDYFEKKRICKVNAQEEQRRAGIQAILKNKPFVLDQAAIQIAAEEFMQALIKWKDRDSIRKLFVETRDSWTEEELDSVVQYESNYIDPIIKVYQPVYDVAIQGGVDQPFAFSSYIHSFFTGFYWSEVDYPEINKPLDKLSELMRGGLSHEEFWETEYYKKHLLPKQVQERIAELKKEGKY